MTNTELIFLLNEARDFMVDSCRECSRESTPLRIRIDAALAERQDKPPCSCGQPYPCMRGCPDCCHSQGYLDYCQGDRHAERQDSATDVVAWRPADQRVFLNGVSLRVVHHTDGLWVWSVYWSLSHRTEQGRVATENEAKQAALAAARGNQ